MLSIWFEVFISLYTIPIKSVKVALVASLYTFIIEYNTTVVKLNPLSMVCDKVVAVLEPILIEFAKANVWRESALASFSPHEAKVDASSFHPFESCVFNRKWVHESLKAVIHSLLLSFSSTRTRSNEMPSPLVRSHAKSERRYFHPLALVSKIQGDERRMMCDRFS